MAATVDAEVRKRNISDGCHLQNDTIRFATVFHSVRTNTGYCVVAEFIVQSESCDHIKEALQILQTWNPDWHPKFFMTDYSEAEIGALEASFPGTTVYLCDFH